MKGWKFWKTGIDILLSSNNMIQLTNSPSNGDASSTFDCLSTFDPAIGGLSSKEFPGASFWNVLSRILTNFQFVFVILVIIWMIISTSTYEAATQKCPPFWFLTEHELTKAIRLAPARTHECPFSRIRRYLVGLNGICIFFRAQVMSTTKLGKNFTSKFATYANEVSPGFLWWVWKRPRSSPKANIIVYRDPK